MKHKTTRSLISIYGCLILAELSDSYFVIFWILMSILHLVFYLLKAIKE